LGRRFREEIAARICYRTRSTHGAEKSG
jgi:hypothetical protein